jgi:excinuclease ABC subunit C
LGPFPSAYQLNEVLGIARRIFPWCNGSSSTSGRDGIKKPCFYFHLDLCPGVCVGDISVENYQENIRQLVLFLKGKKKSVVKEMETEMKRASTNEEYELAAELRDKVELVKVVTEKSYKLKPDMQLHLPKLKVSQRSEGIIYLRRILTTYFALPKTYPLKKIEGYDVSNIQGTNATVALVSFTDGEADKADYRLFNIKTLKTPNDYAMLQEAILRRQNHPEWGVPDLLMIDGGKGQLRAVLKVWNWTVPVISLAKKPDRIIIPIFSKEKVKKKAKSSEPVVVPVENTLMPQLKDLKYQELILEEGHPALMILQQLRDEAHRFSKKQHTRLRNKAMLE